MDACGFAGLLRLQIRAVGGPLIVYLRTRVEKFDYTRFTSTRFVNQGFTGFTVRDTQASAICVRRDYRMSAAQNESDCDPTASD